ncbi:MAG: hypothetical protein K1X35_02460 [Caulobacteraceae bacterium]|nr:hypothetical protein [Caulobacteraceae bacterium]
MRRSRVSKGMKLQALLVAGVLLAATSAAAVTEADLAPAFGNTIVSTHPDGRKARLWLNADHTFTAQGRKGNRERGTWAIRGGKLCLKQSLLSYCKAFPKVRVGATWRDRAVNGEMVTNALVAGR